MIVKGVRDAVRVNAFWHRGGESSTPPLRWRSGWTDSGLVRLRGTRVRRSRQLQTEDDYAVARSMERSQIRGYQGESTVEDARIVCSQRSASHFYHEGER